MAETQSHDDVLIGKFHILATFTYASALLDGMGDDEAKERGIVAAIMGAKARLGHRAKSTSADDHLADKTAAEKKKKHTITAETFDRQVADKMGPFFGETFLPAITKLAKADLAYDQVKAVLKIPSTWGAKIRASDFRGRVAAAESRLKARAAWRG